MPLGIRDHPLRAALYQLGLLNVRRVTHEKVDGSLFICIKHRVVVESPDILE